MVKKPVSTVYVLGNKKKKNDDGSPNVGVVVKKPVSTVYVLGNKKKTKSLSHRIQLTGTSMKIQ